MEHLKTLDDWLAYCEQIHPKGIDMGLERVRKVAHRLGLAFKCLVITVAGTNGKGSTCAMLEAILLEAGYRTGVYTSPHLVHFEERCRIRGDVVSAASLLPFFEAVLKSRVNHVGLHHQVLVDELGRVGVVGVDAAYFGSGQVDLGGLLFFKESLHGGLVSEV